MVDLSRTIICWERVPCFFSLSTELHDICNKKFSMMFLSWVFITRMTFITNLLLCHQINIHKFFSFLTRKHFLNKQKVLIKKKQTKSETRIWYRSKSHQMPLGFDKKNFQVGVCLLAFSYRLTTHLYDFHPK